MADGLLTNLLKINDTLIIIHSVEIVEKVYSIIDKYADQFTINLLRTFSKYVTVTISSKLPKNGRDSIRWRAHNNF